MAYTDKSFFKKIKPMVIKDMQTSGILASLTATQAFIESAKGNSALTSKAHITARASKCLPQNTITA